MLKSRANNAYLNNNRRRGKGTIRNIIIDICYQYVALLFRNRILGVGLRYQILENGLSCALVP